MSYFLNTVCIKEILEKYDFTSPNLLMQSHFQSRIIQIYVKKTTFPNI